MGILYSNENKLQIHTTVCMNHIYKILSESQKPKSSLYMIPFISHTITCKLLEVRVFTLVGGVGIVIKRDYEEGFWSPDNVLCVHLCDHYTDMFIL